MKARRRTYLTGVIILICCVKHFTHGVALVLTDAADRNMTNWALFQTFGHHRSALVTSLFLSAMMASIAAICPLSVLWNLVLLAPQQFLLTVSCYGSLVSIHDGITPSGEMVYWPTLLQRQIPLLALGSVHFVTLIEHIREAR